MNKRKNSQLVILIFSFIFLSFNLYGKTTIDKIQLYQKNKIWYISVYSSITTNQYLREALEKGMTIQFSYLFKIKKPSWYQIKSIETVEKTYIVSYNKITKHYILKSLDTLNIYQATSLTDITRIMEFLENFKLIENKNLPKKSIIKVQFKLKIKALPTYMQLENLLFDHWNIDSDWVSLLINQ